MVYGYARVSARDQNVARQLEELSKYGIPEKRIFTDKKSGKDFDRAAYQKLMKRLKPNDLVVIKSIDRLGRNYDMILEEWNRITNAIGADILVLDMPLLDTRAKADSLVGKFISDIVLQILSFVAENERENLRKRQREGILIAKSKGVRFGRPIAELPERYVDALIRYREKSITLNEALTVAGVPKSAFLYHYYTRFPVKNECRCRD